MPPPSFGKALWYLHLISPQLALAVGSVYSRRRKISMHGYTPRGKAERQAWGPSALESRIFPIGTRKSLHRGTPVHVVRANSHAKQDRSLGQEQSISTASLQRASPFVPCGYEKPSNLQLSGLWSCSYRLRSRKSPKCPGTVPLVQKPLQTH